MNATIRSGLVIFAILCAGAVTAATPPPYLNYQGVLRDSADQPLDGAHDMVFRFFDPVDGELLVDRHTTAQGGAVTVTGGMFDVWLGGGATSDGSGPGTYTNLMEVFRDYGEIYLEVQIGADGAPGTEVLSPQTRIVASAYALNAYNLAGLPVTSLLRSNETDAYTFGTLTFSPGTTLAIDGAVTKATTHHVVNLNADLLDGNDASAFAASAHGHAGGEISGPVAEASYASNADELDGYDSLFFMNLSSSPQGKLGPVSFDATAVPGATGVRGFGPIAGGFFAETEGSGYVYLGSDDVGVSGFGNVAGGLFMDPGASGYAWLGVGDTGVEGRGSNAGGYFVDDEGTAFAYAGYGLRGVQATGQEMGGYFYDLDGSGIARIAIGEIGIESEGTYAGGYFHDTDGTGWANVGYFDEGISAHGTVQGGFFKDDDSTGEAHVAYGDRGISASGSDAGGYFEDSGSGSNSLVGSGIRGIVAHGSTTGGYFTNAPDTAQAWLASSGYGVWGDGDVAGGYFKDSVGSGRAIAGLGEYGIDASGDEVGGRFSDSNHSGVAWAGYGDTGIAGYGSLAGGYFEDTDTGNYGYVGVGAYKILGVGLVSFVQNHPSDDSRVIVYAAPEGDEVATYTRGTARLVEGVGAVKLGDTFAWVTNPDIGLTAHVTPRSPDAVVYVESVSTNELVVRNVTDFPDDAVFDYVVYGLRIGFEQHAVVQPKKQESHIPSMAENRGLFLQDPELREFTALERFKDMHSAAFETDVTSFDMSASSSLREAIHEYDPATDPPLTPSHGLVDAVPPLEDVEARPESELAGEGATVDVASVAVTEQRLDPGSLFAVAGQVEAGDLLTLDPEHAGMLLQATTALDPGLVGIAAGLPVEQAGVLRVALVDKNYAEVKADAGYGEIRPGDLLTSSFTPGHAMRAQEVVPGTIIGKALEPLQVGTGRIRVLVMPR